MIGAQYGWLTVGEFSESTINFPLEKEEQLTELQSDKTLQMKYGDLPFLRFFLWAKKQYPVIVVEALNTTYLCELGFSALTNKNKKHKRLRSVKQEMHVCLP